jgi:hypothetical protein
MNNHNYNAHHSPIGAFASFTLGFRGARGGLGLELGGPANHNVYIGIEDEGRTFHLLPFFEGAAGADEALRYDVEGAQAGDHPDAGLHVGQAEDSAPQKPVSLRPIEANAISRELKLTTDTWNAPSLSFTVYSLVRGVPDPATAGEDALKAALVPAVLCEFTVDNTDGQNTRRAVFGFTGNDPYIGMRRLDDVTNGAFAGIGEGRHLAIASRDEGVVSALGFSINDVLNEPLPANYRFGLGKCGALLCQVAAGEKRTFHFVACFHREGCVTAGLDMRYLYTRYLRTSRALPLMPWRNFEALKNDILQANGIADETALSEEQKWMLYHSVRSYYGSTELLEYEGKPVWVVNEGEYRMMNTFDLTVDHLYWETAPEPVGGEEPTRLVRGSLLLRG